ncbi:glycoside hydrolase family 30 beta sandwich domain-containing protein [Algoriphagus sp. CAU 1675]|uniref:glycoside hydrolase family 30 protein n=1 Tax=Algoriphagus sp. CAU 1675 TaxID=3032597 RepID=UPI0023DAE3D1|nr:glycoside hydrolase family 30 beta sandwich domain-containing protein [Algoriphagus sp. CAU 1675]MDF2158265.1 glycoside hydrolase family 30 beta sandwich domain-containing protein [Algoriphagus sp. CAU 1675]
MKQKYHLRTISTVSDWTLSIIIGLFLFSCKSHTEPEILFYLTDPSTQVLFEKQSIEPMTGSVPDLKIEVDATTQFQSMDGFGFTLSQGSAQHLLGMSDSARSTILQELFGNGENDIRISYLRLSVASSDLNEYPFSYDDLEDSLAIDPELNQFTLGPDTLDVIPVLKEILAINPKIKLMGSPWSPPAWMKDNKDTRGGSLLEEFEPVYAQYLVKYIQEMRKLGIEIEALTIQNEPLHPGNNPSLLMLPDQQARFIGKHLGPAFLEEGIKTKIIVYDHNADRPDYPISVLSDSLAYPFIDGSAFHLYGGQIEALSEVHKAFPEKNLYFTEQWIGAPGNLSGDLPWHIKNLIIKASLNWAKTVLEWNLSSNPTLTPHTDQGGCDRCLGAISIDGNEVVRNPAYYIIAHASKFVDPGSFRIETSQIEGLPNVAFIRPDGKKVLIALNESENKKDFLISDHSFSLNPGAVGTWVW